MSRLALCWVNTSNCEAQDFEAARKKALQVGAKKFFLEVRRSIPSVQDPSNKSMYTGPQARVCY